MDFQFQILQTPYRRKNIRRMIEVELSPTCRVVVPLICFSIVEYQKSKHVMCQFGFQQTIPSTPMNLDDVHNEDMRGRADWNWQEHHHQWIALWNDRHNPVFNDIPFNKNGHCATILSICNGIDESIFLYYSLGFLYYI